MPLFVNRVMLAGNLTRDPELRNLSNDGQAANFGLAINRRYKAGNGEQKEEVVFLDVVCFGRTAELAGQYLTKGRNVHIEGRLKLDQWQDKASGESKSKLRVVADRIDFIGGKDDAATGGGQQRQTAAPAGERAQGEPAAAGPVDLGDDEPPF